MRSAPFARRTLSHLRRYRLRSTPLLPVEHSDGPRASTSRLSVNWDGISFPVSCARETHAQLSVVKALQQEFGSHLSPPADSLDWPTSLLRRWFADGGDVTVKALREEPPCDATRRLIDQVGATFDVTELPIVELDLLGAVQRGDDAALSTVATSLAERDCAVCQLKASGGLYPALVREGERAWPSMRPGELQASDGGVVTGRSPSGAARGDRFVLSRQLAGGRDAWPALTAADELLGDTLSALAARFESEPLNLKLAKRSDTFFACFPGDGLGCELPPIRRTLAQYVAISALCLPYMPYHIASHRRVTL